MNNPISFNDPLGADAATPDWQSIINDLWNTPHGGHSDGSGDPAPFGSDEEAENYVFSNNMGGGPGGSGAPAGNGGVYQVNSRGYITSLTGTGIQHAPGQQILFATAGTNDQYVPGDPSITINTVDIDLGQKQHNYGADYYVVNNTNAGFALFTFLAQNTRVEWSLIIGQISYLSTSHMDHTDVGAEHLILDEMKNHGQNSVYLFIHDHPTIGRFLLINGLYGPSGYYSEDLNSGTLINDRGASLWFATFHPSILAFWVYDVRTGQIFDYTNGTSAPDPSYFNFTGPTPALYQYQRNMDLFFHIINRCL